MNTTESPGKAGKLYTQIQTLVYDRAMKEAIDAGVDAGVRAATEYLERESKKQKKDRYDRRLRNTRLLLKNYRDFKKHSKNAVYSEKQLEENPIEIIDNADEQSESDSSLFVESIKRSQQRTFIMVRHIEEMLNFYRISCEQSGKPELERRYEAIYLLYIDDEHHTYQEVADITHVDVSTVYSDVRKAIPSLSALIFGIDSLRLE